MEKEVDEGGMCVWRSGFMDQNGCLHICLSVCLYEYTPYAAGDGDDGDDVCTVQSISLILSIMQYYLV